MDKMAALSQWVSERGTISVTRDELAWALARTDIESRPDAYDIGTKKGQNPIVELCLKEPAELDALADRKAFLFEAAANHLHGWIVTAQQRLGDPCPNPTSTASPSPSPEPRSTPTPSLTGSACSSPDPTNSSTAGPSSASTGSGAPPEPSSPPTTEPADDGEPGAGYACQDPDLRRYTPASRWKFGDARCGIDPSAVEAIPLSGTGPWTTAQIAAAYPGHPPEAFVDNKTIEDCKAKFDNIRNFRGFPDPQPHHAFESSADSARNQRFVPPDDDGDENTRL